MKKLLKIILILAAVILISIYLFYAIDFGLQLMSLVEAAERQGLREALSPKAEDMAFYADLTWLILMIISILIIPSILLLSAIVYFLRRKRKWRKQK